MAADLRQRRQWRELRLDVGIGMSFRQETGFGEKWEPTAGLRVFENFMKRRINGMKKRGKKQKLQARGSYTVEASLLMGIILPVLVGIIYMGFFLHDRGFLQCAAYEAAVYASLHADDKDADVSAVAQVLAEGRTLGTRGVSVSASVDDRRADVAYEGNLQIPGMSADLFGQGALAVRSGVSLTLERPSRRIQKIRGVAKVINSVRRNRE